MIVRGAIPDNPPAFGNAFNQKTAKRSNIVSSSWIIQQSRDLITWEQVGQIKAEALDVTDGVGFLEIKTLFDDSSMFYRAEEAEE